MDIPFRWWDVDGVVRAKMAVNDDPAALGCSEMARGFPYCEASINYPTRGYASSLGWIPLVRHPHADNFEIDLRPQFRQEHPFGYFGDRPTFFDAPHTDLQDFDLLVHAFLCSLGGELLEFRKEARAIIGFSWGYVKRGQEIEAFGPDLLSAEDWNSHRNYLEEACSDWSFQPGFSQHPLEP